MIQTKVCSKCKKSLPKIRFVRRDEAKDGFRNICKVCDGIRERARKLSKLALTSIIPVALSNGAISSEDH
jgi:hypothetical protein